MESLQELKAGLKDVVEQTMKYTLLELSVNDIPAVCNLVAELVKAGVGGPGEVREGLAATIADLEELVVDCPKAPKYLRDAVSTLSSLEAIEDSPSLLLLLPS